jgi:hypothetical protein
MPWGPEVGVSEVCRPTAPGTPDGMASSTKIGSVVPSQLVEAVTEHLPDQLAQLSDRLPARPELPIDASAVAGGIRSLSETAGSVVNEVGGKLGRPEASRKGGAARFALVGLLIALVTVGLLAYVRNRRSSTAPGRATSPAEDLTLAS